MYSCSTSRMQSSVSLLFPPPLHHSTPALPCTPLTLHPSLSILSTPASPQRVITREALLLSHLSSAR